MSYDSSPVQGSTSKATYDSSPPSHSPPSQTLSWTKPIYVLITSVGTLIATSTLWAIGITTSKLGIGLLVGVTCISGALAVGIVAYMIFRRCYSEASSLQSPKVDSPKLVSEAVTPLSSPTSLAYLQKVNDSETSKQQKGAPAPSIAPPPSVPVLPLVDSSQQVQQQVVPIASSSATQTEPLRPLPVPAPTASVPPASVSATAASATMTLEQRFMQTAEFARDPQTSFYSGLITTHFPTGHQSTFIAEENSKQGAAAKEQTAKNPEDAFKHMSGRRVRRLFDESDRKRFANWAESDRSHAFAENKEQAAATAPVVQSAAKAAQAKKEAAHFFTDEDANESISAGLRSRMALVRGGRGGTAVGYGGAEVCDYTPEVNSNGVTPEGSHTYVALKKLLEAVPATLPLEVAGKDSPLQLTPQFSFKTLENEDIFVLFSIAASMDAKYIRDAGSDLIIDYDVSGSMGQETDHQGNLGVLGRQNQAIRKIIDDSSPRDRVGLIAFQSHLEVTNSISSMTAENKKKLKESLPKKSDGGTNGMPAIETAFVGSFSLQEQDRKQGISRPKKVLVLTDASWGNFTEGQIAAIKKYWNSVSASLSFILINDGRPNPVFTQFAEAFGGTSLGATPENMHEVIVKTAAQDHFEIFQPQGVVIETNYTIVKTFSERSVQVPGRSGANAVTCSMGNVFNGQKGTVLVQLRKPAGAGPLRLTGFCQGIDLVTGRPVKTFGGVRTDQVQTDEKAAASDLEAIDSWEIATYERTVRQLLVLVERMHVLYKARAAFQDKIDREGTDDPDLIRQRKDKETPILGLQTEMKKLLLDTMYAINNPLLINSLIRMNLACDKYKTLGQILSAIVPSHQLRNLTPTMLHTMRIVDTLKRHGMFIYSDTQQGLDYLKLPCARFTNLYPDITYPIPEIFLTFTYSAVGETRAKENSFPRAVAAIITDYSKWFVGRLNTLGNLQVNRTLWNNSTGTPWTQLEEYSVTDDGQLLDVQTTSTRRGQRFPLDRVLSEDFVTA